MIHETHIHMVGLGGIGMSALAQLLAKEGKMISGSDRSPSEEVLAMLSRAGISVHVGHVDSVPENTELLIYSDAVAEDNPERADAKKKNIRQVNYFEAVGAVSKEKRTIAVSGTHGKTTTTGMLGKILLASGMDPSIIIGSIVSDFGGNYVEGTSEWLLVEACEYRRHFLHLAPDYLIITNIEWDHTDYFSSLSDVQSAFRELIARVPKGGAIIANTNDENVKPLLAGVEARVIAYQDEEVPPLQLLGHFNEYNAKAAKALARVLNVVPEKIDESLAAFKGSWRRFEYKGKTKNGADVYDDYAHHPTAIRATLAAAKQKFPDKQLVVAFQPHLYSRTKALFEEFSHAFEDADEVLLAPIYAAREKEDTSVTSERLAEAIVQTGVTARAYPSLSAIREELAQKNEAALIITMGAGDIYTVYSQLV